MDMNFYFGKRLSLVDKVIERAKLMGGEVNLTCCTFEMPQAAGVKLNRAVADGILLHITVYMEGGHRRKKNWVQAMVRNGWTMYNIPMHAKIAILERGDNRCVLLSSNNWQAGGNYEFVSVVDNPELCRIIADNVKASLSGLKPVEAVQ